MPASINLLRRSSNFNPVQSATVNAAQQGQLPTLQKAVVVEVFTQIDMDENFIKYVKDRVVNPYVVSIAPPNSIIAKIVSNSSGNAETGFVVLFPFFSNHLQLPISVGEMVNAIFTDGGTSGNSGIGFWIDSCRAGKMADDPNYTHYDRIYDPTNIIENYSTQDINSIGTDLQFGNLLFNNGSEHESVYTLNQANPNKNPYNIIVGNSYTNKFTSIEPVPRWNKRPNEYVIQGKNNSLIILGEARHGSLKGAFTPDENNVFDNKKGSAIIDLVIGRGRTKKTAVGIAKNDRGYIESNKVPFKYKKQQNPNEGDPDFINDAGRILLTQNQKIDELFGLTELTIPQHVFPIIQPNNIDGKQIEVENATNENFISPSTNNSYAVVKSDHVRIIARESDIDGVKANGSILLVHEGKKEETEELKLSGGSGTVETQGKGFSYLLLNEEGAHINGKYIHFGPAREHKEPAILWSNYVAVIDMLQKQNKSIHQTYGEQIMALQASLLSLCTLLSAIFQSSNVCPPNGPNPAITAASAVLSQIQSQIAQANAPGKIAEASSNLMQAQLDALDKAKAENQSNIIFIS